MRVRDLGEWGLLERLLPRLQKPRRGPVRVGPGDDAAVLRLGGGLWAFTADMLVEGVHFDRAWTSGRDLGHKALAVNLSDLAAMGDVEPLFGLVSLGITPQTPVNYVDNLYGGMGKLARSLGFFLVGGDTVRAPVLTVSLAVAGRVRRPKGLFLRSGARPGDALLATGTLGDAAAGLRIVKKKCQVPNARRPEKRANRSSWLDTCPFPLDTDERFLVRRLLRPVPRLEWARRLAAWGGVTSLMDSSDGLWRSAEILCRASGVGACLEMEKLPLSQALRRWAQAGHGNPRDLALTGGEDYELIFTARPATARSLEAMGWARVVGRITHRREGVRVLEQGRERHVPRGFEHFL